VISRETVDGARKLGEMRRAHGIDEPLQLVLVDLVGAPDQRVMSRKLSSTGLRAVDISKLQGTE